MVGELDLDTVRDFATALLIGTLLGIERERHKQSDGDISVGGLRTFILFAMLGAIGGWLAKLLDFPWILVAVVLATLVAVVASYVARGTACSPMRSGSPPSSRRLRSACWARR